MPEEYLDWPPKVNLSHFFFFFFPGVARLVKQASQRLSFCISFGIMIEEGAGRWGLSCMMS